MIENEQLRGNVAAQLVSLCADGGPLNTDAATHTARRYAGDKTRGRFLKHVIRDYLDRETPKTEGRLAILTAGAPGSGKTSLLHAQVADLETYRILDADIIKDYLIEQALEDGIYDDLLKHELADGHPISPRELAPLVHNESVRLISQIRQLCVAQQENVVVEGTLRWNGSGPEIFDELTAANYSSLRVLGIEADHQAASEQALSRWWDGRIRWIEGNDKLGGRFTPPAAIDICYSESGKSICSANARELFAMAQSGGIADVHVTIYQRNNSANPDCVIDWHYPGKPAPSAPPRAEPAAD